MSGPKSSRYALTEEQRRILAEQRAIEIRKAVASETIKRGKSKLLHIKSMFAENVVTSQELKRLKCGDGGFEERFKKLEELITPIEEIITATDKKDVSSLENTASIVSDYVKTGEIISSELSKISDANKNTLKNVVNESLDKGFNTSFEYIMAEGDRQIEDEKEKYKAELEGIEKNHILTEELKTKIKRVAVGIDDIEEESFLKNYIALTVVPLIKECNLYLTEYSNIHEEFERLYSQYLALFKLCCKDAKNYSCTAASVDSLEKEITELKNIIENDEEQKYIRDCLDDVMSEMGYTVVGSRMVKKKNGRHFKSELYTYGEDTVVNVTYSSDGRIAMELGKTDTTDRLPSEYEADALCESMESFCSDFKELEKRLFERGIVAAERISMLPPHREYAQIINTDDYLMSRDEENLNIVKKQKRSNTHKVMKKE